MDQHEQQMPENPNTPAAPAARPTHLSSNATLFWRVFLPVFGTVFLSGMLLAFWLIDPDDLYLNYSIWWPRILLGLLWLAWLFFIWKKLFPLKRIDADSSHLFVTNYWITVRYPWTDVAGMQPGKWLGRPAISLQLNAPGRFGRNINFFPGSHFREWLEAQGKLGLLSSAAHK